MKNSSTKRLFDEIKVRAVKKPKTNLPLGLMVKLAVTKVSDRYKEPWKKGSQKKSHGSGFIIKHQLIITNAHVVADATIVHACRSGDYNKYEARVIAISPEMDLALLTVSDPGFWSKVKTCFELGYGVQQLNTNIVAIGYPLGGDGVSVTRGLVDLC
jgi:S1-C subfamily serine protease